MSASRALGGKRLHPHAPGRKNARKHADRTLGQQLVGPPSAATPWPNTLSSSRTGNCRSAHSFQRSIAALGTRNPTALSARPTSPRLSAPGPLRDECLGPEHSSPSQCIGTRNDAHPDKASATNSPSRANGLSNLWKILNPHGYGSSSAMGGSSRPLH